MESSPYFNKRHDGEGFTPVHPSSHGIRANKQITLSHLFQKSNVALNGKNKEEQKKENNNKQHNISVDPTDPQSPYFLSSSDSPSNIISPVILNGDKYANGSRLTINALKYKKKKLGFVDGRITKPQDISSLEAYTWERCNSMDIALLCNIIDKNLHGSVAYAETARQIWTDLEERYSQGHAIRVH